MSTTHTQPDCPYCGKMATFERDSSCVYRRNYGPIWRCATCAAWVGCHKGTTRPLGRLANEELRRARISAHAHFDRIWKFENTGRNKAYQWLAEALEIDMAKCHIGHMDVAQCRRVVEACRARREAQSCKA